MSVTLKQIADMAGVHKSTVDKVIHDRPGVSEAKREQIRALLEQYGYESNPLAKALNYQKKKLTVGILLARTAASAALRRGIERVRQDFASFNIALDLRETEAADTEQQGRLSAGIPRERSAGVIACTANDEAVKTALCACMMRIFRSFSSTARRKTCHTCAGIEQDVQQAGRTAARMLGLLLGGSGRVGVLRTPGGVTPQEQSLADALDENLPLAVAAETKPSPKLAYMNTRALLSRCPGLDALVILCGCVPRSAARFMMQIRPLVPRCCASRTARRSLHSSAAARSPVRSAATRPSRDGSPCGCCSSTWSTSARLSRARSARRASSPSRKTHKNRALSINSRSPSPTGESLYFFCELSIL